MTCTKMYMKMELLEERDFRIAVDMDIHGYIHVWISDLGHAVHAFMCDISV